MSKVGNIGGIVLCGGMSRRMGQPKAWLPFHGETMLARVCRILAEVVQPIVVVAGPDQEVPPVPDEVQIVRDAVETQGPLNGLIGGLKALTGTAKAAYLSSCDVPFLNAAFVRKVIESLGEFDVAVPIANGFRHPLGAVYRMSVLSIAQTLIDAGERRLVAILEQAKTRQLTQDELRSADSDLSSLANINTPEQYQAALSRPAIID